MSTPLRSAVELATAYQNVIPPMTHPLGKHWDQPDPRRIQIDAEYARMDQKTFDALADYTASQPTGVYEGKMWKAHYRVEGWVLHWFSESHKPDCCKNNHRKILIHE